MFNVQLHITLSRIARKPVVVVFYQVLHNLMYAAAEDSLMLHISHSESRGIVQSVKQKQVFISCGVTPQLICAFDFSHAKNRFSHTLVQIVFMSFFGL